MANDLLIVLRPNPRLRLPRACHELDVSFGMAVKEKPIWAELYEKHPRRLFPPQLPPLELTSKPIPVPDRMAVKANPVGHRHCHRGERVDSGTGDFPRRQEDH